MISRRHPRSLMEAFPADHWQGVITRYRRPLGERVADVLLTLILGIAGAALLFHQLSKS